MKKINLILLTLVVLLLSGCFIKRELEAGKLIRGSWNDDVFTSEFSGLKFAMPENWFAGTDEEIAALMGISVDFLNDNNIAASKKMLELTTIYDMVASNPRSNDSVMLMYENLALHIGGSKFTEVLYIEQVKEMLKTLNMGYDSFDIRDTVIAGSTFKTLETALSAYELSQFYHVKRINNFMCVIIVTINTGNDDMISNFSKI